MQALDPSRHREASAALLQRFGIRAGGPVEEFLAGLMERFTLIPYENISKIIKSGAVCDEGARLRLPGEIYGDYVERGLGGTCFSLTWYLLCLLHHAGIDAYICMAHAGRRTNVHCVTMVTAGTARFLLDPGYVISAPLPVRRDAPVDVRTPHARVRLDFHRERSIYSVSTGDDSAMKTRYWFRDVPVSDTEFLAHWQRSFSEGTMNDICLTVRRGEHLIYIHGNYLREISTKGCRKRRVRSDLHGVIRRVSGVGEDLVAEAVAALASRVKPVEESRGR